MSRPFHNNLEEAAARIAAALGGRRGSGGWMVRCPAHRDRTPSLSIRIGERALLVHCFAGCDREAVIGELRARDLWPTRGRRPRRVRMRQLRQGWSIPPSGWSPDPGTPDPREDPEGWADLSGRVVRLREILAGMIDGAIRFPPRDDPDWVNPPAPPGLAGFRRLARAAREAMEREGGR